ncbi:response regulator transcription factor [Enterococcus sp. BWB1-3]|uniref:response regulator transcription factor n=1 Tax=unclassified Enterococcus TaxID=2608891 RepID=UPI00192166A2|nr:MULTISPECIES: response regulator transcription factor [unclassified Enterococcus]MBL1228328.1 response regulator transcription factor [Enterococcus sp. BWB1-3]MCB5951148.1 response regulator transcription factor [Enterococcus sp. BWT-B8]MCB5954909.1 response regulator transcription factor [Enterococcus sp. CWB-B31]
MKKIFIVEDERQIVETLSAYLKKWNFEVLAVENFQYVLAEFEAFQPDLVILDISLPFYNGYHWCTEIRKQSAVPIVFLSSASDNMNIVMAMNMGGDDFIAKPFDLEVLVAKIQAIMRRNVVMVEVRTLNYGDYILNLEDFEVCCREQCVPVTMNETKILDMLFRQPEKVVPKELIMEKLWENEAFVDSNTLSVNIARLRKKVSDIGLDVFIQTQKGKGYYLGKEE